MKAASTKIHPKAQIRANFPSGRYGFGSKHVTPRPLHRAANHAMGCAMKRAARAIIIYLLAAFQAIAVDFQSVQLENANTNSNNWFFFPDGLTAPRIIVKGNQNGQNVPLKILTGGPPVWTAEGNDSIPASGQSVFVPTGADSGYLVAAHLDGNRSIRVMQFVNGDLVGVETAVGNIPGNIAFGGLSATEDSAGLLHIAYTLGAGAGSNNCTLVYVRRNTSTNDWAKHEVAIPARVIETSIVASGTSNVVMYFSTSGLHRCTLDSVGNGQPLMNNFTLIHQPGQGIVSGAIKAVRDGAVDRIFYFYANSQTTWQFARMDYTSASNFEPKDVQDVPSISGNFALPISVHVAKGPNNKYHVAWYDLRSRRIHYLTPGAGADGLPYAATQPVTLANQPQGVPDSDLEGLHIRNDGAPFLLYRRALNAGYAAFPADIIPSPEIVVALGAGSSLTDGGAASFGTVTTGTEQFLSFAIRNTGDLPLTGITASLLAGPSSADFTISTPPAATVLPDGATNLVVRFVPAANGKRTVKLQIASNDADENPFDLTLNGAGGPPVIADIGVARGKVTLTDGVSEVDFGNIAAGKTAKPVVLTVSNAGLAALTGVIASIDGANPGAFTITKAPAPLINGKKKTSVTISFVSGVLGSHNAVLHIASSDPDENPFDIVLKGNRVPAIIPEIAVEQPAGTDLSDGVSARDFGAANIGATAPLTFTVRNTGIALLKGIGVKFIGGSAKDFLLTAKPAKSLAPGASTTFTVTFKPKAAGLRTTSLRLSSNDADEKFFDIAVQGTGVAPAALAAQAVIVDPGHPLFAAITRAGLEGEAADPEAMPHGDGVANLLKYAFNLNLAAPDHRTLVPGTGTAGLPVVWSSSQDGKTIIRFEYLRRTGSGLDYKPKFSADLSTWSAPESQPAVSTIDENWERVVYELPQGNSTPRFGIVEVSLPTQ